MASPLACPSGCWWASPRAERHTDSRAQALPQRTGGHIHKRQPRRGMPFKVAVQFAQFEQVAHRKQPGFGPGRIEHRRRMALGKDKAIVVVVMRVFGQVTHVPEEECGHDVRRRTARSRMPAPRRGGRRDRMNPQLIRDPLQFRYVYIVHESANCIRRGAKGK